MSAVHLGRGSVVVEFPERQLMSGLSRFRHGRDGSGEYEELFTFSSRRNTLVTMPGFAERVVKLCPDHRIKDERVPLPVPDHEAATSGMDKAWHRIVTDAINDGGGVVSIPDILGCAEFAAAILRAFPRDGMLYRGTPISIVAAKNKDTERALGLALRELLPGREIGIGHHTDSDDVIVVSYECLDQVPRHLTGIFIGTDAGADPTRRAENISGIRNAARWGVISTAGGSVEDIDMSIEGLFGPLKRHASYADAIKTGVGVPVTVCWLPCPQPLAPQVSADEKTMERIVMLDNPRFLDMATNIMKSVSGDLGCILVSSDDVVKRIGGKVQFVQLHRKVKAEERRVILDDIATGSIRKALVAHGYYPDATKGSVMVAATLEGADAAGAWFPWRKPETEGDKVYIVDFSHDWDVHNGRPGRLARNDEARRVRYAEMGFSQICVRDINELPFL